MENGRSATDRRIIPRTINIRVAEPPDDRPLGGGRNGVPPPSANGSPGENSKSRTLAASARIATTAMASRISIQSLRRVMDDRKPVRIVPLYTTLRLQPFSAIRINGPASRQVILERLGDQSMAAQRPDEWIGVGGAVAQVQVAASSPRRGRTRPTVARPPAAISSIVVRYESRPWLTSSHSFWLRCIASIARSAAGRRRCPRTAPAGWAGAAGRAGRRAARGRPSPADR